MNFVMQMMIMIIMGVSVSGCDAFVCELHCISLTRTCFPTACNCLEIKIFKSVNKPVHHFAVFVT